MLEKRLKISEFAELVGCSAKAVYGKIERDELVTDNEVINGRKVTVIITTDKEIRELQKTYGKLPVNEVQYEDILTDNESKYNSRNYQNQSEQVNMTEIFDKIITLSEGYNDTLLKYSEELISVKSKQLLLEDKAGREGYYLNEINTAKAEKAGREGYYLNEINTAKAEKATLEKRYLRIITVISALFILSLSFLIFKLANPTIIEKETVSQKVISPPVSVQKPIQKK